MGGVINHIEEKEEKKDPDLTDKLTNEEIKIKTPALSALAEKKITKTSVPASQNDLNNKNEPKSKESSPALGIWTFIAFVIAFFAGGWWWVLAIIMGLIWLGNKGENKQENASSQSTAPVINTNIPTNNLSGWAKQLTDICAQYSGNDYFVAELIPAQKLENAMKQYPIPGLVITLIDATLFGSADNGMLIGKKGISWRNKVVVGKSDLCWHDGLYNGNRFTFMTWKYFSKQTIKLENTNIRVGSDNIFDMSTCQFDKNKIIALLNAIQQAYLLQDSSQTLTQTNDQRVYLERENEYKHPEDIIDQVLSQDSKQQQGIKIYTDMPRQSDSIKVTNNLIDLNTADLDTLLALPGIGVAEAKSLIKHRDVAGPFTSTKQVFDFLNLKPHHANQWKDRVVINETISPQTSTTAATPNPETHRPLGGRMID
jgi:DNA uptake protein ComE-like DNA-binding protein